MKIIHAHIFDPSEPSLFKRDKNDKAKLFIVRCDISEDCPLHKKGQCINRNVFGSRCMYGKNEYYDGRYTTRARKYRDDIREWKIKFPEVEDNTCSLKGADKKIVLVGEYYYLPYAHMFHENKDVPVVKSCSLFVSGKPFIHKDEFTVEVIISLLTHSPQALFGGTIESYQKEEVPLFVQHLYEDFNDIFNAVNKEFNLSRYIEAVDYVGRYAYVKTLKTGAIIQKQTGEPFMWNGEYLVAMSRKIIFPIIDDFEELILKLKPSDSSVVKITSNDQVDKNTKFKD